MTQSGGDCGKLEHSCPIWMWYPLLSFSQWIVCVNTVPFLPDLPFFNQSQKPRSLYEISQCFYVGNLLEFCGNQLITPSLFSSWVHYQLRNDTGIKQLEIKMSTLWPTKLIKEKAEICGQMYFLISTLFRRNLGYAELLFQERRGERKGMVVLSDC